MSQIVAYVFQACIAAGMSLAAGLLSRAAWESIKERE